MTGQTLQYYAKHLHKDIPAGLVVFLVALPLCLGIALASGAPLLSGLIAGIIGGLVIGCLSGSQLSVSGPAAGLVAIVVSAISELGGFSAFLLAVMMAGALQLLLGFVRAGGIAAYFPSSVINGMLAGIGLLLIFKQLPLATGYSSGGNLKHYRLAEEWPLDFAWLHIFERISPGAIVIAAGALLILIVWETQRVKQHRLLSSLPAPLLAVAWGIAANLLSQKIFPALSLHPSQLAKLPEIESVSMLLGEMTTPDFTQLTNPSIYIIAVTLAIVASLETLLSLEATDRLDPLKRTSSADRELRAQGIGNMMSGLLGGLPITAVIVRSSTNINAGAHTKVSCLAHGLLLLASIALLAPLINLIPLASLAAILLYTGYKLAKPALFKQTFQQGMVQFVPFVVTVIAILLTDLLKGIGVGLLCSIYFIVRFNYRSAMSLTQHEMKEGKHYLLRFHKDVSFFNKVPLRRYLESIEANSFLMIDGSRAQFIDPDIQEMLRNFVKASAESNIKVELQNLNVDK